jgi:hypothetical protein
VTPDDLIPLAEAVALLARPSRGKKTHTSTLYKWAGPSTFTIYYVNGAKVSLRQFVRWAKRAGKLYTPPVPSFRPTRIHWERYDLAMAGLRLRGLAV